ncbi:MAG: hypothetical protein AAFR52_04060, partial [Pseudomonadota bacterium]
MALPFMKDHKADQPEAFVFSDDFVEIDALAEDLDNEIGAEGWVEVSNAEAEDVFSEGDRELSFIILTLSNDTPEAVERTAALIRKADAAEMFTLLVCGDVSSRSMHMLIRAGAAEFAPYPDPPVVVMPRAFWLRATRMLLIASRSAPGGSGYGANSAAPARISKCMLRDETSPQTSSVNISAA